MGSLTFQVEFPLQCGNVTLFSQTHLSKPGRVSYQWTVKELSLYYSLCFQFLPRQILFIFFLLDFFTLRPFVGNYDNPPSPSSISPQDKLYLYVFCLLDFISLNFFVGDDDNSPGSNVFNFSPRQIVQFLPSSAQECSK